MTVHYEIIEGNISGRKIYSKGGILLKGETEDCSLEAKEGIYANHLIGSIMKAEGVIWTNSLIGGRALSSRGIKVGKLSPLSTPVYLEINRKLDPRKEIKIKTEIDRTKRGINSLEKEVKKGIGNINHRAMKLLLGKLQGRNDEQVRYEKILKAVKVVVEESTPNKGTSTLANATIQYMASWRNYLKTVKDLEELRYGTGVQIYGLVREGVHIKLNGLETEIEENIEVPRGSKYVIRRTNSEIKKEFVSINENETIEAILLNRGIGG